jgi:hypothetical protein
MKKFPIILIGILALLSCGNPFVNSILPDKNGNKDPVIVEPDPNDPDAIKINIEEFGKVQGDSVTASHKISKDGDEITLSYNVAKAKLHNRLVFSGTKTLIEQVDSAGSGSKKYIVNEEDSTEGVITIHAVFSHSDKEFDDIAFADSDNETRVYGSAAFTKAITNTGKGSGAISYASSNPTVATVDGGGAVTILKVGTTDITATKAADDKYEKTDAVYTLTVTHLQLLIEDPAVTTTKTYDGSTNAVVTEVGALANKVGDDAVTVSAAANFASKNAGDRQITVVYTISGADAGNYTKPVNYTIGGAINKLQLTVTDSVTASKPYDGNTNAAVTISSSNKISTDTLTITAAGTYNAATVAGANQITVSYAISGADAGNYIKPDDHSVAGTITKAAGSAVSVPTRASRTQDSITVNAVTILSPNLGQTTVEYAISASTSEPGSGWGSALTFTGLTNGTTYYIFARATGNSDNCNVGTASVSVGMKTITNNPDRKTVINFESDTLGQTYAFTKGQNSPTVKVASDPGNSGQKSLQITTANTDNSWNEAAVIPVYLPYPLSSYESFSFRFRLLSGNTGTNLNGRTIDVYLADKTSDFKDGGFGNPADSSYTKFADKLLGSTPAENFGENHKNKWIEYEITCNPGAAIINLQGNIFIAIGINCQSQADYMLDDLTFILKDDYIAAPYITPTSAMFDLKTGTEANNDITVNMALQGNTLTNITNSGTPLNQNGADDYSVVGNVVKLKKEYLKGLPENVKTTLTFNFSGGTTSTIVITVQDSAKLILNYDFTKSADGSVSGITYSSNNISATVEGGVLKVSKTNTNHTTEKFVLSFNVGTGNLSNYSEFKINIKVSSGDGGYKDLRAWVGSTELGSKQANFTVGGAYQNVLVPITYASANTYTGTIRIEFGLNNTQAVTYEITSIELVPKQ